MKINFVVFISVMMFASCSLSSKDSFSLPYNSEFTTVEGWTLGAGAVLDKEKKAVKLSNPSFNWRTSDRLISKFKLPIKANRIYTISFKTKTETWPPPLIEVSGSYYNGDNKFIANSLGTMVANSNTGIWEENTVYIDIPNNQNIKKLAFKFIDMPKRSVKGDIWIKEVSLREGLFTAKKKPIKKSFNGKITRVDKLGNIEILKNGKYEPFFPIGIYTDNKRRDWSIYKKQGFNIAMWTDAAYAIKKAKDAGLYSSMQIVQYIMPVKPRWIPQEKDKKIKHLKKTLQEIKDRGLSNDLLFYYIDNEFYHSKQSYRDTIDIVKEYDKDKNGNRMHPIYMLNGNYGVARKYNRDIDFTGTYVAEDKYKRDRTNAFVTLNETENQTQPTVIAQINRGVDNNFRAILFAAIAKGARGMGFWKDGGVVGNIENQPWWSELPNISKEIKLMMPLIRANHKTSWGAVCNENKIIYGTRMVGNNAYMIISNPTASSKTVTFKLHNLPYKVRFIKDFFTKKIFGKIKDNTITIEIGSQSAKVIELVTDFTGNVNPSVLIR